MLQGNPRSIAIKAVAKANKLDLEEVPVDTEKPSLEYLKLNKLGKVPSFVGADGYELTESIAIAIYGTPFPPLKHSSQPEPSPTMMRNIINYSYPCLKTTVENHSHSEPYFFLSRLGLSQLLHIAAS